MKSFLKLSLLVFFLLSVVYRPEVAGENARPDEVRSKEADKHAEKAAPKENERDLRDQNGIECRESELSISHHVIEVRRKPLPYTVSAGYMPLRNSSGKTEACVFFISYAKEGKEAAERPVIFAFNGGPGAASVWLHVGAAGPKRALLAEDGKELPKSGELVDNEYTWLDFSDLVFIDPVGAGYSRAAEGIDPAKFYTVEGDIHAAGDFIRLYITKFGRWLSPKFILGESYGATRAAGLVNYLQSEKAINFSGVILLSSALNLEAISYNSGNDLPLALILPSYTAAASYHGKLSRELRSDLNKTLSEVESWAINEYLPALARGRSLTSAERAGIAIKLAAYTGLSRELVDNSDLRVSARRFASELLKSEKRVVGIMDSRVAGFTVPPYGEYERPDPAFFLTKGPYVETFIDYLKKELRFESSLTYEFLSTKVNRSWNWGSAREGYLETTSDLARAVTMNPNLRVFMGAGYYDLTTPYRAQRFTFDHLDVNEELKGNLIFKNYFAGHQIYTSLEALKALTADVKAFLEKQ